MITKIIVIAIMVIILGALASSLFFLVRDKNSNRSVKALTWRISLSLLLFLFLLLAFKLHWLVPNSVS
ncbi:MAG: twin transmembrane helix small protein [Gammaproteobacteria bacterium]